MIRPYGDTRDDGIMQFSFTLPMPYSVKSADVGKQFLEKLGFHTVAIAECKAIDPQYTLFVAYGRTDTGIDPDEVKGDYLEVEEMDYYAINALIKGSSAASSAWSAPPSRATRTPWASTRS